MTLPNFVVVGAFKGATTALAARLAEHPEIYMSPTKETHFFVDDTLYSQGIERYMKFFEGHENQPSIGEADPSYTRSRRYPSAAARMHDALPNAKLIYIVRDPIRRIESHWIEGKRSGYQMLSFDETVNSPNRDIVSTSLYWNELSILRNLYPDNRIHILFTEDFKSQPNVELQRCYDFLCVDPNFINTKAADVVRPSRGASMDREWVSKYLRNSPIDPLLKLVTRTAPSSVISTLRPILRQRVVKRPEWNAETLKKIKSTVKPDALMFLDYAGKPSNFWVSID